MILLHIIHREITIAFRKPAEILNPLWFFLMVITLFPLLMGPNPELLGKIAPGIAWVAALLSALLSFERLFRDDYADGSLEQLMLRITPSRSCKSNCTLVTDRATSHSAFSRCGYIAFFRDTRLVGVGFNLIVRYTDFKLFRRNRRSFDGWIT